MASGGNNDSPDQVASEDNRANVRAIQAHYLRCPSPSSFPVTSETDMEGIFLEPIHLSSAVAAKKIIREELKPRAVKVRPVPESMLESARQLMVEDLYNRVKDMLDDTSSYSTPCVLDIQRAMVQDRLEAPSNPVDEVWPSIFIAEKTVAVNKSRLKRMGITHILNAAHGTGVYTNKDFYKNLKIRYHGVEVDDFPYVDISPHFRKAAEFLDEALLTHQGKVLVTSVMGISRSVVLVAAYLMIFHHLTVMEALLLLRKKRPICPNEGFLKQLRQLNEALLQERDGDEHNDALSQGSVTEAHTRREEEQSIPGAEAHSILTEEHENGKSETSSVEPITQRHAFTGHNQQREDQALVNEQEVDDDNECTIREWQQRNERYQSEDCHPAQLMREHEDSLRAGSHHVPEDLGSICSVDVQAVKDKVWSRGMGRHPQANSVSNAGKSYAELEKQLKESEKEAGNHCRSKHHGEGNITRPKHRQEDEKSLLSETCPLYRSCMSNTDTLTPLARWRVRRIQFGWKERDTDTEKKTSINDGQETSEGEQIKVPALEDVDLTAYQIWKLKRQKKMGAENEDQIVQLSRGQDSASARRKQQQEDALEQCCQNLEESESASRWDTESSPSGGSLPLSTVWSNGSNRTANDDATSLLSTESGCSSPSQIRNVPRQPPLIPSHTAPQVPIEPTVLFPDTLGSHLVNSTSIHNWISNVATETHFQKQDGGIMMEGNVPPNRAISGLSPSTPSSGRETMDEGKVSIQTEASYSNTPSQSRYEFAFLAHATSSSPSMSAYKGEIMVNTVPLYSDFQDQVNFHKLDAIGEAMKSEIRANMASYERQKIAADKCTTLFKKDKPAVESDEDDGGCSAGMQALHSHTETARKYNQTFVHERLDTPSGLRGRPGSSVTERNSISSNNGGWLSDTATPSTHPDCLNAQGAKPRNSKYSSFEEQITESSFAREQEEHERRLRFYPRAAREWSTSNQFQASGLNVESHPDPHSKHLYHSKLPSAEGFLSNSLAESKSYRIQSSYTTETEDQEEKEELWEYTVKRKFRCYPGYEDSNTEAKRGGQLRKEKKEGGASTLSQCRLRSTAKADEDQ